MVTATIQNDVESVVKNALKNTFEQSDSEFVKIVDLAANDLMNKMQSIVAVDKGNLKSSIGVINSKKNNKFKWVGPQYSNRNSAFVGGNHAHIVEFGTKERYMKKGLLPGGFTRSSGGTKKFAGLPKYAPYAGKFLGTVQSQPFVRPTIDNYGPSTIDTLKQKVLKIVEQNGAKNNL